MIELEDILFGLHSRASRALTSLLEPQVRRAIELFLLFASLATFAAFGLLHISYIGPLESHCLSNHIARELSAAGGMEALHIMRLRVVSPETQDARALRHLLRQEALVYTWNEEAARCGVPLASVHATQLPSHGGATVTYTAPRAAPGGDAPACAHDDDAAACAAASDTLATSVRPPAPSPTRSADGSASPRLTRALAMYLLSKARANAGEREAWGAAAAAATASASASASTFEVIGDTGVDARAAARAAREASTQLREVMEHLYALLEATAAEAPAHAQPDTRRSAHTPAREGGGAGAGGADPRARAINAAARSMVSTIWKLHTRGLRLTVSHWPQRMRALLGAVLELAGAAVSPPASHAHAEGGANSSTTLGIAVDGAAVAHAPAADAAHAQAAQHDAAAYLDGDAGQASSDELEAGSSSGSDPVHVVALYRSVLQSLLLRPLVLPSSPTEAQASEPLPPPPPPSPPSRVDAAQSADGGKPRDDAAGDAAPPSAAHDSSAVLTPTRQAACSAHLARLSQARSPWVATTAPGVRVRRNVDGSYDWQVEALVDAAMAELAADPDMLLLMTSLSLQLPTEEVVHASGGAEPGAGAGVAQRGAPVRAPSTSDVHPLTAMPTAMKLAPQLVYSFSMDRGLLTLSPAKRDALHVRLVEVEVDADAACLGSRPALWLLRHVTGYDTAMLNTIVAAVGGRGYVLVEHRGDVRQLSHVTEVRRFSSGVALWLMFKLGTIISAVFLLFAASSLVSFILSQTQQRMLRFTVALQEHVRQQRTLLPLVASHLLDSLVFVPLMLGVLFFLFEFFADQLLALSVFLVVWTAEMWSVASCRTVGSLRVFPRVFGLLMTWFLVYYLTYPLGFQYLALVATSLSLVCCMFHLWNRYELPALASGAVSAQQPRVPVVAHIMRARTYAPIAGVMAEAAEAVEAAVAQASRGTRARDGSGADAAALGMGGGGGGTGGALGGGGAHTPVLAPLLPMSASRARVGSASPGLPPLAPGSARGGSASPYLASSAGGGGVGGGVGVIEPTATPRWHAEAAQRSAAAVAATAAAAAAAAASGSNTPPRGSLATPDRAYRARMGSAASSVGSASPLMRTPLAAYGSGAGGAPLDVASSGVGGGGSIYFSLPPGAHAMGALEDEEDAEVGAHLALRARRSGRSHARSRAYFMSPDVDDEEEEEQQEEGQGASAAAAAAAAPGSSLGSARSGRGSSGGNSILGSTTLHAMAASLVRTASGGSGSSTPFSTASS